MQKSYVAICMVCLLLSVLAFIVLYPWGKRKIAAQMFSIGFTNFIGETPMLVRRLRDKTNSHVSVLVFRNPGIALCTWEKAREALEAALNITIVDLRYHIGKRCVIVRTVSSKRDMPTFLEWNDKLLASDEFILRLGKSALGPVDVDLTHIPHLLLGGSTGSGKTVLLRLLLMQAIKKGARVIVSDFKGGVDFPRVWHERCEMCFNELALLARLDFLVATIEERRKILVDADCRNLEEYNKKFQQQIPRYILACDEVAEVLDKTGVSKEKKELLSQIESRLSLIARQGRAFGIHLIFSTQRPSADLIPGQIRTNLGFRVCGRADAILSRIILDNPAAEQISKSARGRFMLSDGTIFQAYWFNETEL